MADDLARAFTAAYRPYVESALRDRHVDPADFHQAIAEGEEWLATELTALLALPFSHQPRGPLEVFQEAMRFPTSALDQAGAPPADRDEVAVNALPGDVYDLAPASSRDLGEEAWAAHLRWGARKAQVLRDGE
ncbi:MAG: hypothetical protein ACLGHX_08075 [Acidimicrobiia bacterium]